MRDVTNDDSLVAFKTFLDARRVDGSHENSIRSVLQYYYPGVL